MDGLGVDPKTDPETFGPAILIFRQGARPYLCQAFGWENETKFIQGVCDQNRHKKCVTK